MSNVLMVPIHLDALFLKNDKLVAEAMADFTRLPYFNGKQDVNSNIANISEEIVTQPFQNKNFHLKAGIHLHWALPDALTKTIGIRLVEKKTFAVVFGSEGERIWDFLVNQKWINQINTTQASVMPFKGENGSSLGSFEKWRQEIKAILHQPLGNAFPPVPNRWLIERRGGGLLTQKWVVESDYLYPYEPFRKSEINSVNILYSAEMFSGGNPEAIAQLTLALKNSTSLSQFIKLKFSSPTQDLLNRYSSGTPSEELQVALIWEFNQILQGSSLYEARRFSGIKLSQETQRLLDSNPKGENLVRLNRLLLEAAYPECKAIGHQPFRYLGRKITFEDWLKQRNQTVPYVERLDPLTAVGYGEPTFAAFYPNCHSVFGFFDSDIQLLSDINTELEYTVVGWYDRGEEDYFRTFVKHAQNTHQNNNADLLAAIQAEFKWKTDVPKDEDFLIPMLCYARTTFDLASGTDNTDKASSNTNTKIAIGNTGTEALAAYLSHEIVSDKESSKLIIEDQLEALHLLASLEHRQVDVGLKFEEARHEKGFNAVPAGTLWTIRSETETNEANAVTDAHTPEQATLPEEIARCLNELNLKQQEYDRALDEIESLRHRLFSDWYKYMVCAYPPEDSRDDYPNIDEVKHYIEVKGIDPLNEKLQATGELKLLVNPKTHNLVVHREKSKVVTATASESNSIASKLAEKIDNLLNELDNYNRNLRNSILFEKKLDCNQSDSNFILHGSPTVAVEERFGNCLSFAGENDYIQLLGLSNTKAVSMCVKIPSVQPSGDRYLLNADLGLTNGRIANSGIGDDWTKMYVDGQLVPKQEKDSYKWEDIPKNRWVHLYLQAKMTFSSNIYLMGNRNAGSQLKGKIAYLRVYNRDLTPEEIARDRSNTIDFNYILKKVSAPRYWQHNEPVILIAGEEAKYTQRHGSDGRLRKDNLLECQLYANSENKPLSDLIANETDREKIVLEIDKIENTVKDSIAFSSWKQQPWHPFLLEWEVEVLPVKNHNNLHPETREYEPNFIRSNYTLEENDTDLSVKPGEVSQAANIYRGSCIVTPHASFKLKQEIKAYLLKQKKSLEETGLPSEMRSHSYFSFSEMTNIDNLRSWYENKFFNGSSANKKTKTKDPIYTAIRVYQKLQNLNCFSQVLGGFNAGLLMHKQTMQLRIDDPIGFNDYKAFTERVRQAVCDRVKVAPLPFNDFNPIRTGVMRILRLRLIDTFGQVKDLDLQNLTVSDKLLPPSNNTLSNTHDRVFLPPRLVQPSRLNFRWLSADRGEQESNSHPATTPICGWLLPNNLDNSLMVYDASGNALGSVNQKAGWNPAPGTELPIQVNEIDNLYLRRIVEYFITAQAKDSAKTAQTGNSAKTEKEQGFIDGFISVINTALENIEPENFAQHQDLALLMGNPIAVVRASLNLELQGLPAVHCGWNEFRQDLRREERDTDGVTRVKFPVRIGEYQQLNDGVIGYWQENQDGSLSDTLYAPQSGDVNNEKIVTHPSDKLIFWQAIADPPQTFTLLIDPRGKVHATCGILPVKAIDLPPSYYSEALKNIEITFLTAPILTDAYKIKLPLPNEAGYAWSWLQKDKQQKIEDILDRTHIGAVNPNAIFGDRQEILEGWLKLRQI